MGSWEALSQLLFRGAELAQHEARRILDELIARGDLSDEEAAEIELSVQEAVASHRRFFRESVMAPLRGAWGAWNGREAAGGPREAGGASELGEVLARLSDISERLERLEREMDRARGD